jgi:malate dehydrogenase
MKISIIGAAGTIGSCAAFVLANNGLTDEIVMMDKNEKLARSHAMDIGVSTIGHNDMVVRWGEIGEDLARSDIVIISAGIHYDPWEPLEDQYNANIPIISAIGAKLGKHCPDAVVIVITNPLDPLTLAAHLSSQMDRKKFIGYNLNDSLRFKMITAEVLGVKATELETIVMGEHPGDLVPLFSSVKVNGRSVSIPENTQKLIQEKLQTYLKTFISFSGPRTAGWTSASGVASIVKAVKDDTGQIFPCSACLKGEYGFDGISMGVPVVLGREGIREILEWDITADERQKLQTVAKKLMSKTELARRTLDRMSG